MNVLQSLGRRLREPSTYAGLGVLGLLFGVKELQAFSTPEIAGALAALAAVFAPESK